MSAKLEIYRSLLLIRQKARRRDLFLIGGLFLVSFIATLALGLLDQFGRSVYLITGILVAFGVSYILTWVRLEVIRGIIEVIENLQAQ